MNEQVVTATYRLPSFSVAYGDNYANPNFYPARQSGRR